jgi:signal transduction histidine kinase
LKNYSLEKQLSQRVILLNTLIFIIVFISFNIILSFWLTHEHDEEIEEKAKTLTTLIKYTSDGIKFDFTDEIMPKFKTIIDPEYFQLWFDNKLVIRRSRSLKYNNLEYTISKAPVKLIKNITLPDGRDGRMVQLTFLPEISNLAYFTPDELAKQKLVTLVVAREREQLDFLINTAHVITIVITVIILFLLHFLVKLTVRKSLLPIHNINQQIQDINAKKLHNQLKIDSPPDEFNDFIEQFNLLLNRLDTSFYREQRFSSDVAHELRTPIAELLTMSEIALKWPDDTSLAKQFYTGVYDSSVQMQILVNNLLALARCDKGHIKLNYSRFKILDIINICWQRFSCLANEKQIKLICNISDQIFIESSLTEFEQIINNLMSNAISYSESPSDLIIQTNIYGGHIQLLIENTTHQLEYEDLNFIFDRLWRKNKARSSSDHSGLGLSLVKAYVDVLNLNLKAELTGDNRFIITINNIKYIHESTIT